MAAPKDFVTGFNHNVRHKGQGYHVQTEDSGTEIAHVITHLFQGGNILASKKTSYAELRGSPDLKAQVRLLMEEQHRQMLRELVNGAYDEVAEQAAAHTTAQPRLAPPAAQAEAKAAAATPRRTAPIEVVRFPPPGQGDEEDLEPEIDLETSIGFLPSVEVSGGPHAVDAEAIQAARDAVPAGAPNASPQGAGGTERAAPPTTAPFPPAAAPPLWPTATEAAQLQRAPAPVSPGAFARTPGPAGQLAVDAPLRPAEPGAVQRTPGPPPWVPEPQADRIFGDEADAAEKSLDQVILRYLAGERDE